jgi:L-serine/L-threonine ammonia-lyase
MQMLTVNTCPPFGYHNSLLWTGHSSIMDEVVEELPHKFVAFVASVDGGGLICGILEGIARHSLYSTRVITSKTERAQVSRGVAPKETHSFGEY